MPDRRATGGRRIRVLLVDDQPLIRLGFRMVLEGEPDLEVVGEADDGAAGGRARRELVADVVIMDVRMPGIDGIAATARIVERAPGVRVLIVTTFDLDEYAFAGLRAGASGFLLKNAPPAELVRAIRTVAAGDAIVEPRITRRLLDLFGDRQLPASKRRRRSTAATDAGGAAAAPTSPRPARLRLALTEREAEVFTAIARGLSNAEISSALYLSESTVKTHVGQTVEVGGGRAYARWWAARGGGAWGLVVTENASHSHHGAARGIRPTLEGTWHTHTITTPTGRNRAPALGRDRDHRRVPRGAGGRRHPPAVRSRCSPMPGHMTSDLIGLVVALVAAMVAARPATDRQTYGYRRAEVLGALVNGVILVVVAVSVSCRRDRPARLGRRGRGARGAGVPMLVVAVLGLLANVAAMLVLRGGAKDSINLRGAYLEVLGDLIGSALVIIAAVVIVTTGSTPPTRSRRSRSRCSSCRERCRCCATYARALRVGPRRHRRRRDPRAPARYARRRRGARRARVADHVGLAGVQRSRRGRARGVRDGCTGELLDELGGCLSEHFDVAHSLPARAPAAPSTPRRDRRPSIHAPRPRTRPSAVVEPRRTHGAKYARMSPTSSSGASIAGK